MVSIVCSVRVQATLYLVQLAPFQIYMNVAEALSVAAACGIDEGLKGRVTYCIIFTHVESITSKNVTIKLQLLKIKPKIFHFILPFLNFLKFHVVLFFHK